MMKNLKKNFNVVFDTSNKAFWDTERNTTNRSPLQSSVFEKNLENCQKLSAFNKKCIFDYF